MKKPTLTRNIDSLLKEFASDNYTPLESCDFSLVGTVAYVKYPNDESYCKIPDELYQKYSQDINSVIKDKININQIYKIELYISHECTIKLDYEIKFDQFKTHPKLVIFPTSYIPYKTVKPKELYLLLMNEINKIKAKNRILVNFHNNEMHEDLKKFIRYLYADKFIKPVEILLFEGIEPELSVQSSINLIFKNKISPNHQLIEIDKDEIILEYRKPVYGYNGFNCFGKQIDHGELEVKSFDLEIDEESIYTIEKENRLILKSKKRGFVEYYEGRIAVSNIVEINKISRVQSKITDDENNDIKIIVSQNDITQDSVGEGAEIVSERIHVKGHIGSRSTLEATDIIIDGATHKDSNIFAKNTTVNRHKGTLRCNKAKVTLLEGGKVHATYAEIGTCLGGSIYAQDVVIDHVKNNVKIYASNSITIRLVSGEDNHFIIDYRKIPVITSKMAFIDSDIDDLKFTLEEANKSEISKVPSIKNRIKELKDEKEKIKDSSLDAKITIQHSLNGLNVITFVLPNNKEISYKTVPKKYDTFYISMDAQKVTLHPVGTSKEI